MPVKYRSASKDFDDLFDPDVIGDGPSAAAMRSGGKALKYAALKYGTKRANVGYRAGGSDVSNLWAAKGTAQYVSDGGLPDQVIAFLAVPPGTQAHVGAEVTFQQSGTVRWQGTGGAGGLGTWAPGGGASYSIRFDVISQSGLGVVTGTFGVWQNVAVSRSIGLTLDGPPHRSGQCSIRFQIRDAGQVVRVDREVLLRATISA